VTFAIVGCGGWDVPPQAITWKNPVPSNPETLAAARQIYAYHCQKCHGIGGDGKIPPGLTYSYFTRPTNFTNTRIVNRMSDGEIFWKISHGNRPMPPFKNRLSAVQRWELVDLIRAFAHPQPMNQSSQK